jgi:hypothetical protein
MNMTALQARIEALWAKRDQLSPATTGADRASVEEALEMLDSGQARVAEPDGNGGWKVNQWLKQAVLMSFRLADSAPMEISTGAYDKVPLKFEGWGENRFREAGFRVVPGAVVRRSAYIARNVVLMPSFVNLGARVLPTRVAGGRGHGLLLRQTRGHGARAALQRAERRRSRHHRSRGAHRPGRRSDHLRRHHRADGRSNRRLAAQRVLDERALRLVHVASRSPLGERSFAGVERLGQRRE